MKFIRRTPAYPKDRDLSRVVQAAAERLARKLDGLDPHGIDLSSSARALLCQRRESVKEEIERCAHVFAWALPRNERPFSDLSLVAFADRLGLFALLARECSIGTVVCHNTEGADVDDARVVAKALGSPSDHYVFGDLEDLEFVLKHRGLSCDVFVSRGALDVLESVSAFFDAVCERANGTVSLALGHGNRLCGLVRSPSEGAALLHRRRDELSAAGFQMSMTRAGRSLILSGSRSADLPTAKTLDSLLSDGLFRLEKAVPRS